MEFAKGSSSDAAQQAHELRDDVAEDIVEEGALEFEEGQFRIVEDNDEEFGEAPKEDNDDMNEEDGTEEVNRITPQRDDASKVFQKHTDAIYVAGVSPDGTIGVSGSGDESACLFPLATGTDDCVELKGHSDSIIDVKFNASGNLLATASLDSTIRVWDVSSGSLVRILEGPSGEIEWCEWHTKADIVLAGAADGTCWMWDASRGDCMQVFAGHEDSVTCGGFTLNGKKIVTGSMDGSTRLWSPKTGMCMHTFTGHGWHQGGIVCTALHPSQPTVIAGGVDGTARIARLDTKKILGTLDHAHAVPRLLGAAGTSTRRKQQMEEGACSVEAVSFCDVQDICCTGGTDGEVKIWDIKTMQCKQACTHEDAVTVAKFIPGTSMVLSASMDGTVRVWDARNGSCIKTLLGHRNGVLDARFVEGTRLIVTASDDHTSRVFSI